MNAISLKSSLAIVCASFGMLHAQERSNLIKDPSFEEMNKTGVTNAWKSAVRASVTTSENGTKEVRFCIVENYAQEGNQAAQIEIPIGVSVHGVLAEWSQVLVAKPNARYYFSVYIQNDARRGWPCAIIEEVTASRAHADYGSSRKAFHVAKIEQTDEKPGYQLYGCPFETGPDTLFVNVSLRFQDAGEGAVLFDNATLIER